MNDINIADMDGSTGRDNLLQLVKGCPEDSSGVSHAMVPMTFPTDSQGSGVKVISRAIFKRDLSTNKQGVASMVMQVKIPYVRLSPASAGAGTGTEAKQAVVTKDYISCHIVLALPKSMLTDWRDSSRQRDAELQLNALLTTLNTWAYQYGVITPQIIESGDAPGDLRSFAFQRLMIEDANPSRSPTRATMLLVAGQSGQRVTNITIPFSAALRDPLTDPLMSAFNGVCADVKPAAAVDSTLV